MKKGFVLVETMVVSIFVLVSIIILYKSFNSVMIKAKSRNNYDTITDVYKLKTMLQYIDVTSIAFPSSTYLVEVNLDNIDNVENALYSSTDGILYALKSDYSINSIANNNIYKNSLVNYIRTLDQFDTIEGELEKYYFIYEYTLNNKDYYYVSLKVKVE